MNHIFGQTCKCIVTTHITASFIINWFFLQLGIDSKIEMFFIDKKASKHIFSTPASTRLGSTKYEYHILQLFFMIKVVLLSTR